MTTQANTDLNMNAARADFAQSITAAYVGNNTISVTDIPTLINDVAGSFDRIMGFTAAAVEPVETVAKATPAQIRKSITPDALISFIDNKPYKTLKRHLTTHGMTVAEYKAKYGLPVDYPTTAPSYSEARSAMAKALGLGQGGRRGARGAAKTKAPARGRANAG